MEQFFELIKSVNIPFFVGIIFYIVCECVDWLTGVVCAKVSGKYKSKISKNGILIKSCHILFYTALVIFSEIIQLEVISIIVVPQIITTITSIVENLKEMKEKGEENDDKT